MPPSKVNGWPWLVLFFHYKVLVTRSLTAFWPAPTLISIMFCFPFCNPPGYFSDISLESVLLDPLYSDAQGKPDLQTILARR